MTGKKALLFALWAPLCALGQATFTNPQPIVIPDGDPPPVPASPYPSEIHVTGLDGSAYSVQVTLHRFTHTFPAAADLLVVAPDGTSLVLLSDAGGAVDVSGLELRFSDSAASAVQSGDPMLGGVYRPSNYGSGDQWPLPAPPPSGASTLAVFNGTPPNGTWRLYVVNDIDGTVGAIEGGWTLRFFTQFSSLALILPAPKAEYEPAGGRVALRRPGPMLAGSVEVDWSPDGRNWLAAGQWTAASPVFYHRPTGSGPLYYRLRQGARRSHPIGVAVPGKGVRVRWAGSSLTLPSGREGGTRLQLTDLQGRPRFQQAIAPGAGEVALPTLPPGLYLLQVNAEARWIRI